MIRDILNATGVEYAQGRFIEMPKGTHAVYFDDVDVTGPDRVTSSTSERPPHIYKHNATVEVYEPAPDDEFEAAIETELNARGIPWTKQARYWLKDLQRYQVIYEFSYTIKSK